MFYAKSFLFGLREGSLERKPKINKETKNVTVVYTKIFNVNIIRYFISNYLNPAQYDLL